MKGRERSIVSRLLHFLLEGMFVSVACLAGVLLMGTRVLGDQPVFPAKNLAQVAPNGPVHLGLEAYERFGENARQTIAHRARHVFPDP